MAIDKLETIVTVCCMPECYKIKRREEFIDVGKDVFKFIHQYYNVSHGYCPSCLDEEYKRNGLTRKKVSIN